MRKLMMVTLLVIGLSIPASMQGGINGTDRTNAARSCSSLRASLGSDTFGRWYHSYGSCVSVWVSKAHAARVKAGATCTNLGRTGRMFTSCVTSHTRSSLSLTVGIYRNAAKACAAEMVSMGVSAFDSKYGVNAN